MTEFEEDRVEDLRDQRRQYIRWGLSFAVLFAFVFIAFWWSGSAIKYGATRMRGGGAPSYQITGVVRDSVTHGPIPWAQIATDFSVSGKFFETTADADGAFTLMTMPEPQKLVVSASGYQQASVPVGRQWFSWLPSGKEEKNIELHPR